MKKGSIKTTGLHLNRTVAVYLDKRHAVVAVRSVGFPGVSESSYSEPEVAVIESDVSRHVKPRESLRTESSYSVAHSNRQRTLENRNENELHRYFESRYRFCFLFWFLFSLHARREWLGARYRIPM